MKVSIEGVVLYPSFKALDMSVKILMANGADESLKTADWQA